MPYDPDNPPDKVRNLPENKQRQWCHVFNTCYSEHEDDAKCHKMAWGTVNKSLSGDSISKSGLDPFPTEDELLARERRFKAQEMENEAKIREVYGDKQQRRQQQFLIEQEWANIDSDSSQGLSEEDIWKRHLMRMKKELKQINDPKALRIRAKHLELEGFETASNMFEEKAEHLDPMTPEKDAINKIQNFNAYIIEKYEAEPVGTRKARANGYMYEKQANGTWKSVGKAPAKGVRGSGVTAVENKSKGSSDYTRKGRKPNVSGDVEEVKDSREQDKKEIKSKKKEDKNTKADVQKRCLLMSEIPEDKKNNAEFKRLNKGVCTSEKYMRDYDRKSSNSNGDLSSFYGRCSKVFNEIANALVKKRNAL